MAFICENCGKRTAIGRSKQHKRGVAGKRWKNRVRATPRLFRPNLQWKTLMVNGEERRMRLCTKCIKLFKSRNERVSFKTLHLDTRV